MIAKYGIEIRYIEGTLARSTGTGHGTPYEYDRHVPLVFYGAGVRSGESARLVRTADAAPTLAELLGILRPAGLDGSALIR